MTLIFRMQPACLSGQRIWGAIYRRRQFIIVEDAGKFTASFRNMGRTKTVYLIDYVHSVDNFEAAKLVCEQAAIS